MAVETAQQPKDGGEAKTSGLPKLLKPYFYLTSYYAGVAVVVGALLVLYPPLIELFPIGGAIEIGATGQSAFEPVRTAAPDPSTTTLAESIQLAISIISSFVLMLPVTWICMGARRRKDVSQSFIQTILVLPLVITGIVHVVHNSLALAFSLAGIVAGVRFRHTLKDSAETTYLFVAIAVGVSCGINAVEVAAIISIFFNYTVLGLWATEFGAESTGKQMFSREWMQKEEEKPREISQRERKDKNRDEDEDD